MCRRKDRGVVQADNLLARVAGEAARFAIEHQVSALEILGKNGILRAFGDRLQQLRVCRAGRPDSAIAEAPDRGPDPGADRLLPRLRRRRRPDRRTGGAGPSPHGVPTRRDRAGSRVLGALAGDAAGVVAPASGEGIYYAMLGGRLAAEAVAEMLRSGKPQALASARKRFMREHGRVFWVLGVMQHFWYSSDKRRERFVSICRDRDVQQLTFDAYMHKRLVRARPMAHVRIFFKDMAHLLGLARV